MSFPETMRVPNHVVDTMLGYMAIDELGHTYHIGDNPPRKWLLNYFGRQHCRKMYRDNVKTDKSRHVGYIIAEHWLEVFCVCTWKPQI